MSRKVLIWDFDGTLAYRAGMWSGALIDVLDRFEPSHGIRAEQVRPFLRQGFPWHNPEEPHPQLCDPAAWWRNLEPVFTAAYRGLGIDPLRATDFARHVRVHFTDPTTWSLYPEVTHCIDELSGDGWRHVILSNHVPELEGIVAALELRDRFVAVHTSALLGFEKPNPNAYRHVLDTLGSLDHVYMIGDNPLADLAGAGAVGIPGILVRSEEKTHCLWCSDLTGVRGFVSCLTPAT